MNDLLSEQAWLDAVRASILHGEITTAHATLTHALAAYPDSADLQRTLAGVLQRLGQVAESERLLHRLLDRDPADSGSAFALADLLKAQGRTAAAAAALRDCLAHESNRGDADLAIAGIELLDDIDRRRDAAGIAEAAVARRPDDARLHAYAGMLAIQLADFQLAREHYLFALAHDPRALEWHVPIGLSSTLRYRDAAHPDLERFRAALARRDLSPLARAELGFALGKAFDDMGDPAQAAEHFRDGNAIRHHRSTWSTKAWRRMVAARLATRRARTPALPTRGFTPVFVVGMPRTGTTLLAELLTRRPGVCNRGELGTLAHLAQEPTLTGTPDCAALQLAAATYVSHSRQDDAPDARWFIDKQPLNFRYLDLALTLFPDAKVIHCQRGARDNALSLWMQCFLEDVHDYSYDFGDMALVMRDEGRLMSHWRDLYPDSIRAVRYEELVADPKAIVGSLADWIGLPALPRGGVQVQAQPASVISTASLWQARQPVYTRSIHRADAYLPYVPELAGFRNP